MKIKIRLAKPEEITTILELQSQALTFLSAIDYTATEIEAMIQTQGKARTDCQEIVFVAEEQETSPIDISRTHNIPQKKIIGFSCLSSHSADINGIYIHPDRIRQNIGTQLLQAIEAVAIEKRYRRLWVSSALNAIKFYQANGYQKKSYQRLQLNNIHISVAIMSKQLIPLTESEKAIRKIGVLAIAIFTIFAIILIVFALGNF
ncbi:GNAT family N-acetyltransferase [Spirulina sp. 06S082]|uniref:GNAT family N-acetyltransferase n=1 Tax=Spirulina sp. 06S082 TaxID=3110248 RepID=UPI002B20FA0A|nr:GNAT family N-acetyltransferase [Spirulina sp. 06S082]MEA5471720.1 GNAT family N-acetyltransferase [Spirulina sp. 06S082]